MINKLTLLAIFALGVLGIMQVNQSKEMERVKGMNWTERWEQVNKNEMMDKVMEEIVEGK